MEHPITPPSELVEEWDRYADALNSDPAVYIATQAARWGADQELEACCEWLDDDDDRATLRAARRPKPPSLKQQALEALNEEQGGMSIANYNTIRSVLESLPDPLT